MSNRYLKTNSKAKKGISPVIATVILVAVAVVIAAAMAGFAGSLFGTYSGNAQVQITNVELTPAGIVTYDLKNNGGSADGISEVRVAEIGADDYNGTPLAIPANSELLDQTADLTTIDLGTAGVTNPGQTVTMVFKTQSGAQITQSVTVGP